MRPGILTHPNTQVLEERKLLLAALLSLDRLEPSPSQPPSAAAGIDADIDGWVTSLAASLLAQASTVPYTLHSKPCTLNPEP